MFPAHELFPKLGAVGLFGLEYDEAYGGMGADHSFTLIAAEELGRVSCGGVPMAIAVQMSMSTPALHRYGSAGAEGAVPGARHPGRGRDLDRGHRARCRQRRRRHPHPRRARRRRVGHQRLEALHHQRGPGRLAVPAGPDVRGVRRRTRHVLDRGADRRPGRRRLAQARETRHVVERHGGTVVLRRPGPGRQHHRRRRPRLPAADGAVPGRAADDLLQAGGVDRAGAREDGRVRPGAPGLRGAAVGQPVRAVHAGRARARGTTS